MMHPPGKRMAEFLDQPVRIEITCTRCGRKTSITFSNKVAFECTCQICGGHDFDRVVVDPQEKITA